ncbi:MAG: ABC transporter permease [Vicinamibacterales bacterium]
MRDDIRTAVRSLLGSPSFSAVALTVLALGIGATTAIFSVVDAVVLRGLPFDEDDRIMAVGQRRVSDPPDRLNNVAPQNYQDWAAQQQAFEAIAAVVSEPVTLHQPGGEPEELRAQRVTTGFFDVLRVHPRAGRAFTADNEVEGRHFVAIISDALWKRRFGADPAIVGRTIPLEGGLFEVAGVMPPGFEYPVGVRKSTELWIPYVVPADERIRHSDRRRTYLHVIARLHSGVTQEQARERMEQVALALEQAHPSWNRGSRIAIVPLYDSLVGEQTTSWMLFLLAAVGFVLLIACANVANLMLARASVRRREIAVRAALGASRWRIARQVLTESLVLAVAGTALGAALAWFGVQLLRTSLPSHVPRVASIALDLRVLGAAALLAVITAVLFGLVPAIQASRPDLTTALADGGRGSVGPGGQRTLRALVVGELAIAVVLLVGAGLFIGSFLAVTRIDTGFDPANVVIGTLQLRPDANAQTRGLPMLADVVEQVRVVPGVQYAAAVSGGVPLSMAVTASTFRVGQTPLAEAGMISVKTVSPDYFRALRIPLEAGRGFVESDSRDAPGVVVINEAAAREHFPTGSPIGQEVRLNGSRRIVGVVGDVRSFGPESTASAEAYVPLAQVARGLGGDLIVRSTLPLAQLVPAIRAAVYRVVDDIPIRDVRTMDEMMAERLAPRRFNMLVLGLFGVLALMIAAVGIYGVMSSAVSQRRREIGVRIALGATRRMVVGLVLRGAGVMITLGLVIGGAAAWYLSATVKSYLFRVEATDPRVFAAALGVLAAAALVASVIPARRAATVDPMIALRAE